MRLTYKGLNEHEKQWAAAGIVLPVYDAARTAERTKKEPVWLHFGAGNIFRGFIAGLMHDLLNKDLSDTGIIAAETFDFDIIDRIFKPHDHMSVNVTLHSSGAMDCAVCAAVAEAIRADTQADRLVGIFAAPSLQMVSLTITEKGYTTGGGSAIAVLTGMLLKRFNAGGFPVALVSMDNYSRNGDRLKACVLEIAETYHNDGFLRWLNDETKVTYPWTMIDKITPRPDNAVARMLTQKGLEDMSLVITSKQTFIAPFVNAERPQYLVIEDNFPNGRPPLEQAGVIFTDRATVEKTERMKVTVCLNPLHTAMAVFGCLLGYTRICDEMNDPDIVALIKRLGYDEGLPVVADPGILSPAAFLDEVINERLPNPFLPDTPQRIATDTSQKLAIRFGETIKSYIRTGRDLGTLRAISLAISAWLRYLQGEDDEGRPMTVSPDPMKEALSGKELSAILSDVDIFGLDLTKTALADSILEYFVAMRKGPGSIRATLHSAVIRF